MSAGFTWQDDHLVLDLPGAHVRFTSRRGGVSSGAYASLNLGPWTDDDPAAVAANRSRVAEGMGATLAAGRQVHGTRVRRAESAGPEVEEADGQATTRSDLAPLVLTADCLPVAVAGRRAVAMLHAGWRGLAGGILAEGVRALRELGDDGPLQAAIGPGAGRCCYETGDEVRAAFAPEHADGRFLDLKAAARAELTAAGVGPVHDAGICTMCGDPSLWFSHRRDGGVTGRQAGVVRRTG